MRINLSHIGKGSLVYCIFRVSSRIFGLGGKVAPDFTGSTLSVLVFNDF